MKLLKHNPWFHFNGYKWLINLFAHLDHFFLYFLYQNDNGKTYFVIACLYVQALCYNKNTEFDMESIFHDSIQIYRYIHCTPMFTCTSIHVHIYLTCFE
jgi:hypothetical protein